MDPFKEIMRNLTSNDMAKQKDGGVRDSDTYLGVSVCFIINTRIQLRSKTGNQTSFDLIILSLFSFFSKTSLYTWVCWTVHTSSKRSTS